MTVRRFAAAALAIASANAFAADATDIADVISATPIIEKVNEPRRECWNETVTSSAPPQERSLAAPILGGATGALIGRQVGQGSGNTAATAIGAVAGAIAGDRIGNPSSDPSYTGSVLGGAAGAIIGNQVGQGRGNIVATAAGAIAGALVGDRLQRGNAATQTQSRQEQHCKDVDNYRDVVKGYTVVYRYNGRDITTALPYNPGKTVTVGIGVLTQGKAAGAGYDR